MYCLYVCNAYIFSQEIVAKVRVYDRARGAGGARGAAAPPLFRPIMYIIIFKCINYRRCIRTSRTFVLRYCQCAMFDACIGNDLIVLL